MKEIVAECKPFKKTHICRMNEFLEDAQAKVLSPKRYIAWLQKKVDNTRGGYFRKPYLEKMARFLDRMGKRDEAIAAMEANKDKDDVRIRGRFFDPLWVLNALQAIGITGMM